GRDRAAVVPGTDRVGVAQGQVGDVEVALDALQDALLYDVAVAVDRCLRATLAADLEVGGRVQVAVGVRVLPRPRDRELVDAASEHDRVRALALAAAAEPLVRVRRLDRLA